MSLERLEAAVLRFTREVRLREPGHVGASNWQLPSEFSKRFLESMLLARHLDLLAHRLRAEGKGHYTITSSGHEANVVLGALTRTSDPTLLHYRSAAAQIERARQCPELDMARDIALSLVAAASDPLCSGRHKAFGSRPLGIIPQTSTIASQLPRALGLAFGLDRSRRLGLDSPYPADAIALVSFGDASLNHSTAQGALNALSWVVHQRLKLPLLLVCEDNQLGISTQSPAGWVATRLRSQPHLSYFEAKGWELDRTFHAARAAIEHVRLTRLPAVLHLECRRLLGHAGSDVDESYRSPRELEEAALRDPVLCAALALIDAAELSPVQVLAIDEAVQKRVAAAAELARTAAPLQRRAEVMVPLAIEGERATAPLPPALTRERTEPATLAQGINHALADLLEAHPEALIFGEDVAKKGGVYGVTKGLFQQAGPARVFNTLLDEQTILGLGIGAATLGMLPIVEIQYLAYLHNAEDQLRGEAATLRFFSNGAYDNPMIVRIAGLGYQKGFGGHFHNDNSLTVLRDIPGIVVGVPARADDASAMYRAARNLAVLGRQVLVMVEPIALYHERNLYRDGDGEWLTREVTEPAPLDRARVYHADAKDVLMVSYGNGVRACLRAAHRLERERGIRARVLDLRWIKPLPLDDVARHVSEIGLTLVVDECRRTGSVSEELLTRLMERVPRATLRRVCSADSLIPLGEAASLVLLSEEEIATALGALLAEAPSARPAISALPTR